MPPFEGGIGSPGTLGKFGIESEGRCSLIRMRAR
jgi:hypothetical protein